MILCAYGIWFYQIFSCESGAIECTVAIFSIEILTILVIVAVSVLYWGIRYVLIEECIEQGKKAKEEWMHSSRNV